MSAMPDSTLTDSEQLIADLQRQLAECRAEREEAQEQQTATPIAAWQERLALRSSAGLRTRS